MGTWNTFICDECGHQITTDDSIFYIQKIETEIIEEIYTTTATEHLNQALISGFIKINYCGCGYQHKTYEIYQIKPELNTEEAIDIISMKIQTPHNIGIFNKYDTNKTKYCPKCNDEMLTENDLHNEPICPVCKNGRLILSDSTQF